MTTFCKAFGIASPVQKVEHSNGQRRTVGAATKAAASPRDLSANDLQEMTMGIAIPAMILIILICTNGVFNDGES